jgi:hypothetical protein
VRISAFAVRNKSSTCLQQVAISEHRLQRVDACIAAQDEDAVKAGFVGELAGIGFEDAAAGGGAQIAAIGRIADRRLVATLQLLVQCGDDGAPIDSILLCLCLIAANDIAPPVDLDFLDPELGLLAASAFDSPGSRRPAPAKPPGEPSDPAGSRSYPC